jgi:hypothetical protein
MAIDRGLSALLGGAVIYAFTRVIEVVHSDVSLLKLQAQIIESAIAAKNAKDFEGRAESNARGEIAGEKGFGRPLQ